jgi:hypothetical protein
MASARVERAGAEQAVRVVIGSQGGDQRAKALMPAQDAGQQGDKMHAGGEAALGLIGAVLANQAIEARPKKLLDHLLKNGRLMAHGMGSAARGNVGERRLSKRWRTSPQQ